MFAARRERVLPPRGFSTTRLPAWPTWSVDILLWEHTLDPKGHHLDLMTSRGIVLQWPCQLYGHENTNQMLLVQLMMKHDKGSRVNSFCDFDE